jgi:hypothetical protein
MVRKENFIGFRLYADQYETIKKAAEGTGLSASEYCRRMSCSGRVIHVHPEVFREISDCTKKFYERDRLLKQILFEIHRTGKYYAADLEIIQNSIDENRKQQEEMFRRMHTIMYELFD